ncbi:MAG: HAD-IC family P-type ATPase [Actinomycetes bacterium]
MQPLEAAPHAPVPEVRTPPEGLTEAEVADRRARGLANVARDRTSRSIVDILRANVVTRFNAILGAMLAIVLVLGDPRDGLFGLVLFANSAIGIVQELRAKRTLDALSVLHAPRLRVVRSGVVDEVLAEQLVRDDVIELRAGDQVPADGVVLSSDALAVDESLLTGESDAIAKHEGDDVLSGSVVVAGAARFQATAVGEAAYAHRLAAAVRRFALVRSEISAGIDRILKWVTVGLLVVGPLLFWNQLRHDGVADALIGAVAGVVGMVPEGLVLLTSLAFGVAAVTLARRQVLVQELPAVEVLARVDVVCLDKTGTLTQGSIALDRVIPSAGADPAWIDEALGALAADDAANATLLAIRAVHPAPSGWVRTDGVPFSSARKWSATGFAAQGSFWLGAPEMLLADPTEGTRRAADEVAASGARVLVLLHDAAPLEGETINAGARPVALVVLAEQVRPDAADTLAYFREQGVTCKVISGDNPLTVGAVARRVGLDPGVPIDARTLPDDPDALAAVVDEHTVFGRVTPEQKRAMVGALQSRGHVVAMTGDGVNDALALKAADIGVAMGSGAPATRAVAKLVLLDGRFDRMPGVVAEGRRVIANVERVANLFLTKSTYAALIAIAVVLGSWRYPFLPRHLTIVSSLTIGIPAFFLALEPNAQRYMPGFVGRVLRFAIPAGVIATLGVLMAYGLARRDGAPLVESRTLATLTLVVIGLWVLGLLARPLTRLRALLLTALVAAVPIGASLPFVRDFFDLTFGGPLGVVRTLAVAATTCAVLEVWWRLRTLRNAGS